MEQLLERVESDINKYGNVRPATLKKLEKVLKEHQNLDGRIGSGNERSPKRQ